VYQWLLTAAPPAVLVGVALFQIHRVDVRDLTPWKGGGFGMFSTLDGRENRHLIITLLGDGGSTRVVADLPTSAGVQRLVARARAMPTAENLENLAGELAGLSWRVPYDNESRTGSQRARVLVRRTDLAATRSLSFDRVEVVAFKLRFESRGNDSITPRPEVIRTVDAPRKRLVSSRPSADG
jgi:hypothetical protein